MISLETIGYFSDVAGSQKKYPDMMGLFYPDRANFIAFVGILNHENLVATVHSKFRETTHSVGKVLLPLQAGPAWAGRTIGLFLAAELSSHHGYDLLYLGSLLPHAF